ncbi:MAG: EAL domain-containing protein, partial [Cyanobacteria bacterium J06600_6]
SIEQALVNKTTIDFEYSLELDNSLLKRREYAASLIWFSVNISPISDSAVIWIARDITSRKEKEEEEQYIGNELAQITLQSIGDSVITTDADGRVQYLNPSAESLTGWSVKEAKGKLFAEVFYLLDHSGNRLTSNLIDQVIRHYQVSKLVEKNNLVARNGICYEIEGSASPIMNRQQKLMGTVTVFRDVTQARKMARKLSWQASHDSLTKLYNRHKFEEFAAQAIADVQLHQAQYAFCYLDLDRFKIINDTCGHAAGDRLLCQVTNLLSKRIRRADIFARLGGDEFGIIFRQCPIEVAFECANELRQLVEDFRFIWQDKVFRIGVSMGLVAIKPTTETLNSLFNYADAACYVAKQQGGNCVHLCDEQDIVFAQQQGERQWIEKINCALEKNDFRLYIQKIVPIQEFLQTSERQLGDGVHYEVLLRLNDSSGNIISPGVFLPAAERYGLMPAIDRWVISNFFAGYEAYCQSEYSSASQLFTINLSGASINNQEFGNFLRSQFDRYSIPPKTICFEITETVAITNLEQANILISQLKELGCSIALDDFGSGMSSLTYLKNLPIDYLKIDGSFVTNIANDELDYATVECFNHISQIMNIKTIAEFVEDQTILKKLRQIGVDFAQGYGIERPKPLVWN